jgi:hypothetical protein
MSLWATRQSDLSPFFYFIDMMRATGSPRRQATAFMSPKQHF